MILSTCFVGAGVLLRGAMPDTVVLAAARALDRDVEHRPAGRLGAAARGGPRSLLAAFCEEDAAAALGDGWHGPVALE